MKKLIAGLALVALLLATSCVSQPAPAATGSEAAPAVTAAPVQPRPAAGQEVKIAILHVNDTHGHPLAFADHGAPAIGGIPAIATLVGQTRAEYENVLFLDAGDMNTGRPESNFFKAEPDILGYSMLDLDASVAGNHEFDNDAAVFAQQMEQASFPFLCANITTKDGKGVADAPYIVKNIGGLKVGIFGLTTSESVTIGNPSIVGSYIIKDEVEVGTAMVAQLRNVEKVDIVIALVHMGIYSDDSAGSRRLAAKVPGIDLIVDGHTHTKLDAALIVNGTPIVQAWNWGMIVGKGILTWKDGKVTGFEWAPVSINDAKSTKAADGTVTVEKVGPQFEEHPVLQTRLIDYQFKVAKVLDEVIGASADVFPNKESRKAETAIGDLVADSMLWYVSTSAPASWKPDFVIQNGGGIRADFPAGTIKKKDAYTILPFDNTIAVLKLKGTDVQALFDFIVTIAQGKGAFPQVSDGVTFTINYETGKAEDILIGGQPIDPAKIYVIATNNYMAAGGDGYVAFKNNIGTFDSGVFQRDAFIMYMQSLKGTPVAPVIKNRIKIIGSKTA